MKRNEYSILYVDDEERNLRTFKALYRRDYNIHIALSGQEGLKVLETNDIQLIITGQRMPGMTGIEFIEKAQLKWPDSPYILLTGYTDHEILKKAVNEVGIYRYINKPFDHKDMTTLLDLSLEAFQLRQDKEKLKHKLDASQQKLSKIVETAIDAIVTIDSQQNITLLSPAAEKMFGYSKAELLGCSLSKLIPESAKKRHSKHINNFAIPSAKPKYTHTQIVEGVTLSGKTFPIETAISKMNIDGELYFNAIIRDITNKKKDEEALRQSEEEFRLLAESAPNTIWKINSKYEIEYVNNIQERNKANIVGKSMFNFIPKEDHTRIKQTIAEVFKTGNKAYYEVIGKSEEGIEVWYSTNVGAIIKEKEIVGALLIVLDISEKKEAEKKSAGSTKI